MKYVVILGDGMADYKLDALGGKTCLEYAKTPNLDLLAPNAEVGLCKTVPQGLKPGSDVANMSVMGFNPKKFYTGRSPIEAVAMGISLKETDVTLRANIVTLSGEERYEDKTMVDYSAGEITTAEAKELIEYLKTKLDDDVFKLYPGVSYRHCLVVDVGVTGHDLTPPHDISDRKITEYLPKGPYAEKYLDIMKKSYELLKDHPVNRARIAAGKNPANSLWLWGEGTKPMLDNFNRKTGLKGGVISAVDLVKGIAMLAGMKFIPVKGATGNYDTDFKAKANAAADELLGGLDYVYIHMEGPDECGHHGDYKHKVFSIEQIDGLVVKTLKERLEAAGEDYAMLVCPDHPTPCTIKTHISDPIPYLLYTNVKNLGNGAKRYTEDEAAKTGKFIPDGYMLIDEMLDIVK
ncbi:MAG: cofactor-independent phosphoglycerate mutase, partial [Clostridia bacterium]|nr:cofactor-independent phosphoglycerate mutase [Clostridia bacterium]